MRIEITKDQFDAMERLALRFPHDPDAAIVLGVVEEKKKRMLEHNLKTIAHTTNDEDLRRIANKEYRKSKHGER